MGGISRHRSGVFASVVRVLWLSHTIATGEFVVIQERIARVLSLAPTLSAMTSPANDPVRARRERIAHLNLLANRIGYLLWAFAIACFVMAFAFGFKGPLVTAVIVLIIAGSILLAPSIIIGYAVKAAERDDREKGL